jgi:hypothetical protein
MKQLPPLLLLFLLLLLSPVIFLDGLLIIIKVLLDFVFEVSIEVMLCRIVGQDGRGILGPHRALIVVPKVWLIPVKHLVVLIHARKLLICKFIHLVFLHVNEVGMRILNLLAVAVFMSVHDLLDYGSFFPIVLLLRIVSKLLLD